MQIYIIIAVNGSAVMKPQKINTKSAENLLISKAIAIMYVINFKKHSRFVFFLFCCETAIVIKNNKHISNAPNIAEIIKGIIKTPLF